LKELLDEEFEKETKEGPPSVQPPILPPKQHETDEDPPPTGK
jgi:hypothetical protein